jgi:hypothetical protein
MLNLCRIFAVLSLLLAPTVMLAAEEQQRFPPFKGTGAQYPGCPGSGGPTELAKAVDVSNTVDDPFLEGAKKNGVKIIVRYYEWPDAEKNRSRAEFNKSINSTFDWREGPVWAGKRLDKKELIRIRKDFKVAVVFQHDSSSIRTFQDPARPAYDAKAATDLARELNQPHNTVIFFGADFAVSEKEFPVVEQYFRVLSPLVRAAGYKVGVYGEGYVCRMLKEDYVSHCWLSQSTDKSFLESMAYDEQKKWQIKQCAARQPYATGSWDFNPDIIKEDIDDVSF